MGKSILKLLKNRNKGTPIEYTTVPEFDLQGIENSSILISNSFCKLEQINKVLTRQIADLITYTNEEVVKTKGNSIKTMQYAKDNNNWKLFHAHKKIVDDLKGKDIVCLLSNDYFPTGLLPMVEDFLKKEKIKMNLLDYREIPADTCLFRLRNEFPELRYYQKEMVQIGKENRRGVFESAVGSGKTLVILKLIKELNLKTLIIVPSTAILVQTREELEFYFGSENVTLIESAKIKKGNSTKNICIATIQTLASLYKQGFFPKVVTDVDMIMVDEMHHAAADSFIRLLPDLDHVHYRFGFTGTFLRNDSKEMELYSFLSKKLYEYPAHKAIKDGFLTPMKMKIVDVQGNAHKNYQKEYVGNYCNSKEFHRSILKLLKHIPDREQILILVDRKFQGGDVLHDLLTKSGYENSYVNGDHDKLLVAYKKRAFNNEDIRILIGSAILGEGVDIRSSQHLILANGGKSVIKFVQALGRVARLHPGKKVSYIYDFNFHGTNYMEKHCEQRQDIYEDHINNDIKRLTLED